MRASARQIYEYLNDRTGLMDDAGDAKRELLGQGVLGNESTHVLRSSWQTETRLAAGGATILRERILS